ncbi:uncharacterized protein LOC143178680 [Calliopsis andreniformis]|uniref:uncharacterized protein LOC143178680 n=1 Tax=Calliopsis andreniformis TaxID=337506 RepID=UPI003FCD2942
MSSTVSRLTCLLCFLFIVRFSVAFNKILFPGLPRSDADEWPRDNPASCVPNKWRSVSSEELQSPQIEIQLLKESIGEDNWVFSSEYKYSSNNQKTDNSMESLDRWDSGNKMEENEGARMKENSGAKSEESKAKGATGRKIPQFDSRTVIDVPSYGCPPGQAKDPSGQCREIIQFP